MNRRALEAATNMDGAFNDVLIKVTPGNNETIIMDRIDTILAPYGGIDAYPKDDQISYWFINNELSQLQTVAFIYQ